jgi:cysteine-rich repeat protein
MTLKRPISGALRSLAIVLGSMLLFSAALSAEPPASPELNSPGALELLDGTIQVGGHSFGSWNEYFNSEFFQSVSKCGLPAYEDRLAYYESLPQNDGVPGDCTFNLTNPSADYDPSVARYRIAVVFHIIENTTGSGYVSEAQVRSQIDILNEDFLAIPGTPGAPGADTQLEFYLATVDPDGNPTTGITYSMDDTWFNDGGGYYNTLAWDTNRYMNIYSNTAGGNLGYVPNLPQGGIAGSPSDRIVVLWSTIGRNGPGGPPYDQGRTVTHEAGHYFGLEHTFSGGCDGGLCYEAGDLICDTNAESSSTSGCPGDKATCGNADPIDNYMDYSHDTCMEMFTPEQARRQRCSLIHYRPDVYEIDNGVQCGNGTLENGEECDEGDTIPGDGCNEFCLIEHVCGNAQVEPGEECDDGNTVSGDGCNPICIYEPVCGDGIEEGTERCDDGDSISGDGCSSECTIEYGTDCCSSHSGSGCDTPSVQQCVCALNPICCFFDWGQGCADTAKNSCSACDIAPREVSPPGSEYPLAFSDVQTLIWQDGSATGSDFFNLYRGDLGELGSGNGACFQPTLGTATTTDAELPLLHDGFFYLVSGGNPVGESPLGRDSSDALRDNSSPCP